MITAAEAKELSHKTKDLMPKVYEAIRQAASVGMDNVYLEYVLSAEQVDELKGKGFSVVRSGRNRKGRLGFFLLISW